MKILVFAKNETELKELLYELELRKEKENNLIVVVGNFAESTENNIAKKNINSYTKENTNKIATEWIKWWAEQKSAEGKNFREIMVVEGVSWWWFMEHWLYSSYAYMDPIKGVVAEVFKAKKIIDVEKPDKIVFINDDSLFSRSVFCISKNLSIDYFCINKRRKINLNLKNIAIKHFLRQGFFMRKRMGGLYKGRLEKSRIQAGKEVLKEDKEKKRDSKKILAISVYNWTNVVDIHSGKAKPGNPYLTPILDELKKNENVELKIIDIPYANLLGINKIGEKINAGYDVFESYYSSESGKRFHKMQNEVLKKWSSMRKLDSFRNSFIFQGINIWALVEPQFNCYFSTRLEAHARDFETIKEMIDAENPELVMYSSDIDEFGRMLFYLCSQRSIPTVAVQHGTLPKTIPLFIYKKFELKNKYTAPPLPTKLVVYGEYYKDFFSKLGNYPEEKIAVCGNQRYDYYLIMREKHTKDELCRELSLAPGKKTIALLTQPLPLIKEREEILDSVCRAVREIPNSQLIIKLHPAESSEVMHRRIARQNKLRDFIVVKDIDNFKIMHICDALIGPVSTLDYEAMLLEKPVIVLNLKKAPEEIPFVKEGSAIGVYEQEKIARALRNVLFDDELVRNLKSNMRKTVRRHLFRNDGKASGRIASVALKLLRL